MNNELKFLIYNIADENISVKVVVKDETIWLTQKVIAELFDVNIPAISKHLSNIFADGELDRNSTVSKMEIVQVEGARQVERLVELYNLDAIISVGYRVNSQKATHFRIWATSILKEYMIKGFAMDDTRLKRGETTFGKDYFRELLERVRSIRASERRIWQQITDIFAECSIDYDKDAKTTQDFYAMIQNKFHYAITGKTDAEIIDCSVNIAEHNMGLLTWKNAPDGRILKSDVTVAKNYLSEKQIKQLERSVSGYFDYLEDLIDRENTFTMNEFTKTMDKFLEFREYRILKGKGNISKNTADNKAKVIYEEFNKTQKIQSDFDRVVKKLVEKKEGDVNE